ncbi:MAG: DUF4956 domain-containing protein [Melioribacter sp.]|uniref:DUF4956 domain-containing protein n=1 Tax=Melioribacter sp. TaxID=2052167 RepID=UPI003BD0A714
MHSLETLKLLESFRFGVREALLSLSATAALSLFVAWVYHITHRKKKYSKEFLQTLVFISAVVSSVMLVIGNNLAGAFGLIGAVSIIRFRTKVKNPQDTAYIFFVMAIGVACGFKYYYVALVSTVFIGTMLIIFSKLNFTEEEVSRKSHILRILVNDINEGKAAIEKLLDAEVEWWDIYQLKTDKNDKLVVDYIVNLKKNTPVKVFLDFVFNKAESFFTVLEFKDA